MTAELFHLLHHMLFGGLAAAGFGILFNIGLRAIVWCAAAGALALLVRTLALDAGWTLEGASFAAAVTVGSCVQVLSVRIGLARSALAVAGCIPMVPGSFAAKAIIGLFALAGSAPESVPDHLTVAIVYLLRVTFTIGAIGAGLAIPSELLRRRDL